MRVVSALLAYWMGREPPRLLPKWRPPNKLNDLSFVQLDAARGPSGANQVDERQADLELNLPLMPFVPENEQDHVAKASREGDSGVVKVHSHLRSNFKSAGQHGSLTGRKQAPESSEAKNQDIRKVKDEEFPDLMPDLETEDPPPTQEPLERHETDPSPEGNENERSNQSPASNENADTTKVKDETLPDILPDFEGDFDDVGNVNAVGNAYIKSCQAWIPGVTSSPPSPTFVDVMASSKPPTKQPGGGPTG